MEAAILFPGEAESYVEALEVFSVESIGSPSWLLQHERVEKLNQQAVASATTQTDEFVKEFLVTHEKIPVLIHNIIATEVWNEKVLPHLLEKVTPQSSFQLYMMMYHEAPIATLLETVMFHSDTTESADDFILDLLDYCYRKVTDTIKRLEAGEELYKKKYTAENVDKTPSEDLQRQKRDLDFCIGVKAMTILRYICEHLNNLPLSVTNRILNTLDIPGLFVSLVVTPPWVTNTEKGDVFKFADNEWRKVEDLHQISKTEGQVWIGLFHLLMDPRCHEKYEITTGRKAHLIKLRSFLNEIVVDQIPMLGEMQRYLEHLAIMDPPTNNSKDILIEQVPELFDKLCNHGKGKWKQIASQQLSEFLSGNEADMRRQAKRWMETYNFDVLENLVAPPKCVVCGELAAKRCSQCHGEWYCRRECQVKHWTKHKTACDLLKKTPSEKIN